MRQAVHCSGYSLAEQGPGLGVVNRDGTPVGGRFHDWTEVCLGDPAAGRLGRIPMAIRVAQACAAELLIWSTGATYLSHVPEAEIMMQTGLDYLDRQGQPSRALREISVLETDSTDTATSMVAAARIVAERFGGEPVMVHLVTSANHAPRVARDAVLAFSRNPRAMLAIVPAHTSYGRKNAGDVVIRELGI